MNCETVQNRLLALPDPSRVADELRGHLSGCPACQTFLARAIRLDRLIASVPVPLPSEEAKASLLDRVTEAGPVIKHIPVVRLRDSSTVLLENGRWKYTVAALAAAVLIAVGWVAFRGGKGTGVPGEYPTVAGHTLLKKTLGNVVTDQDALSRANTPEQRMRVWSAVTGDLRDEVRKVHRHALPSDLAALATLFDKAAQKGLLEQARLVARDPIPADQRRAVFQNAFEQMSRIEADAAAFAQTATQDKKAFLQQIQGIARKVRDELSKLEPRLAGTTPGKGV